MSDTIQRIGILTGGGDCPGLNAVIRAAVKTAINEYGWEVLGIEDGFDGLIKPDKARLLDITDVRGLLPRGGTMLGSTNRANPFHYEVSTNGEVKVFDVSETVLQRVRDYGIDVLLVIGGDGTMRIAQELMQKGLQVVGVPKTIDNDLYGTEVTVGFDTAVTTAMEALDKLHTTAEGSALHVMLFLENLIRALLIFNGLRSQHGQRALLGYHYQGSSGPPRVSSHPAVTPGVSAPGCWKAI
jgi:ATP-dependent phosphofructokinase / diphosphate-dependent phosphofructokinase